MDRLSIDYVVSQGKVPETVARALLDGVSQDKLEELLVDEYGLVAGSPQVSITRMNTVGGLRAMGYEVNGGRKGRGQPYQIVGWAEKQYPPTADQWIGEARRVLDFVEQLPRPTYDHLRDVLAKRPYDYLIHENSPGYVLSYELARDTGFVWGGVLVLRKHVNYPRFRVFVLDAKPDEVISVVRQLSEASLGQVHVLNIDPSERDEYRRLVRGSWGKRKQAVYHCDEIAELPGKFLNKRSLTQLRKNDRECFLHADWKVPDLEERVVRIWKEHLESRHRQLAITRDFVGIKLGDNVMHFLGTRGSVPVATYVVDRLPNRDDTVIDILNKSLNYTTMPSGHPGTSDWLLVNVSRELVKRGIKYLLAGGLDGGGDGLEPHKRRFTTDIRESYAFYPEIAHLSRESLMP